MLLKNTFRKVLFPLFGFFSLLWFLIRVIPKPTRAAYPCQRVAFPVASTFILWVIGIFSSVTLFKSVKKRMTHWKPLWFLGSAVVIFIIWSFTVLQSPSMPLIARDEPFDPIDDPNSPVGIAKGINPGRVVWAHDPDATSWKGSGYWWKDSHNNQDVIDRMLSQSIRALTGAATDAQAWDALFRHFNTTHGRGDVGYQPGENITIKLNLNSCNNHSDNRNSYYNSPHAVLALTRQLVNKAGVNENDITYFDATRYVPSTIFDKCKDEFPSVKFKDWQGRDGRRRVLRDESVQVHWSEELTLEPGGGNPTFLPRCVTSAVYLINLGSLKGHNLAGVTLTAKNMFGSIMSYPSEGNPQSSAPKNAGLHPYVCVHSDFHFGGHWDFDKRAMGTYNALVDLMGHQDLGGKTMLFMIDGLYSAPNQSTDLKASHKWQSAPFNGDWPSSIFISQDEVALESVCLDFMRNEPTQDWVRGNVDNYLHEAAQAGSPPSGKVYDPEGDGTLLKSLGVHEHWNNASDRQYTRNLGTGDGIELVKADEFTDIESGSAGRTPDTFFTLTNYPNPFNSSTRIRFTLPKAGKATLSVYNAAGQKVTELVNDTVSKGQHEYAWNAQNASGRSVPSGIYFVRLTTETETRTHKITLAE